MGTGGAWTRTGWSSSRARAASSAATSSPSCAAQGYSTIRAVDIKPLDEWYQRLPTASRTVSSTCARRDACRERRRAAPTCVYNLAADMGGMGFIETQQGATACSRC